VKLFVREPHRFLLVEVPSRADAVDHSEPEVLPECLFNDIGLEWVWPTASQDERAPVT